MHGKWEGWYPNGVVQFRGEWKDDDRTGDWEFYFENGQLDEKGAYDENGKKTGKDQCRPSGITEMEGTYRRPADGKWSYFYLNGSPQSDQVYKDGLLDGKFVIYNRRGKVVQEAEYKAGGKHGTYKRWNEQTGELEQHFVYEKGAVKEVIVMKQTSRK